MVVTGGGTGIGFAIAKRVAEDGATVVIASRNAGVVEEAAAVISDHTGHRCLAKVADAHEEQSVEALFRAVHSELGRLDALVNNAGGVAKSAATEMTSRLWDRQVSLNLRGPFLCAKAAARIMIPTGGGSIVNVSSNAGGYGVMGAAAYSAAKAGLENLTRVLAAEWGPVGVRVNAVSPGLVETPLARQMWDRSGVDTTAFAARVPLGRLGSPNDVAGVVSFFLSSDSGYVSGQTLRVDGGPQLEGSV